MFKIWIQTQYGHIFVCVSTFYKIIKKESFVAKIRNFTCLAHILCFPIFWAGQMAQRSWSFRRFTSRSLAGDVIRRFIFLRSSLETWLHAARFPRCSFMRSIARLLVLSSKRRHWSRNLKRCKLIVDVKISMPVHHWSTNLPDFAVWLEHPSRIE